jgi:hypothetical protein
MARGKPNPFWKDDTIAAAALAATGTAAFQSKLDALAIQWNSPALSALVEWWPLLLIIGGLILLLLHPQAQTKTRNVMPRLQANRETRHGSES